MKIIKIVKPYEIMSIQYLTEYFDKKHIKIPLALLTFSTNSVHCIPCFVQPLYLFLAQFHVLLHQNHKMPMCVNNACNVENLF